MKEKPKWMKKTKFLKEKRSLAGRQQTPARDFLEQQRGLQRNYRNAAAEEDTLLHMCSEGRDDSAYGEGINKGRSERMQDLSYQSDWNHLYIIKTDKR